MWMLVLTLAACLFSSISAHCPKLEVMEKFNLSRLDGLWYEWSSFGTLSLFPIHACHVSKFYIGSDQKSATVVSNMLTYPNSYGDEQHQGFSNSLPSKHVKSKWHIIDENQSSNGNLTVRLKPLISKFGDYPLSIIDTDYDNYLIFMICKEIWPSHLDAGYLMTRKNGYGTIEIAEIYKKVDAALAKIIKNHSRHEIFTVAYQEKCAPVNLHSTLDKLTPQS